jgi:transposase
MRNPHLKVEPGPIEVVEEAVIGHRLQFGCLRHELAFASMEKDSLARLLDMGLSLDRIGARVGRDASTIGYWVRKHGLSAVHAEKHAPRGGLTRGQLEVLIAEGLSQSQMAERLDVSTGTVQYWLSRHGLRSAQARRREEGRRAKEAGRVTAVMTCSRHGETEFWLEGRGTYRCLACRRARVAQRRRTVKQILVSEAGGSCRICGYSRSLAALHFHHLDPEEKRFGMGREGVTRSLAKMREEAQKCVLLCANCHAEVEAGIVRIETVPATSRG